MLYIVRDQAHFVRRAYRLEAVWILRGVGRNIARACYGHNGEGDG